MTHQTMPSGPARRNSRYMRWALWTTVILFMCGLGLLPWLVTGLAETGFTALIAGTVLGVLPVPLYLALALWIDRYEKEPLFVLALAFLWGATVASVFSYIFNSVFLGVATVFVGSGPASPLTAVVSAPLTEETSKGLALLILFLWKRDEFDGVVDGIVYAAMVGLGFAMTENFAYYGRALADGLFLGTVTFVLRGVISPFIHPIFTAMTGIGLGLARQSRRGWVKIVAPTAGLLAAMALHATWNFAAVVLDPVIVSQFSSLPGQLLATGATALVQVIPMLLLVLAFALYALRREGRIVRHYLVPELESGLISRPEYEALGSVFGRLRASSSALGHGFGAWRAYSRFAQTATELAFHRDRAARGVTSVDTASRDAAYVQSLRSMRGVAPSGE